MTKQISRPNKGTQDKRPGPAKIRRQRKPHPTQGWFSLGERANLKEKN